MADGTWVEPRVECPTAPGVNCGQGVEEPGEDINLRDVAENLDPGHNLLLRGKLYRSSQFHTQKNRDQYGIKAILDLRQAGKPCKKAARLAQEFVQPSWWVVHVQDAFKPITGKPIRCPNCESKFNAGSSTKTRCKVYHLDLVTPPFKYKVFTTIPKRDRFRAIKNAFTFKSPSSVVSKAVADPDKMGYGKLYVYFLEYAKGPIKKCFTVLADAANYPVLVHCIHGKDRTGVLVMLILRICGASFDDILEEYLLSAKSMKAWHGEDSDCARGVGERLDAYLTTRQMLSVEREYMQQAIDHILERYGDVPQYLATCGIDEDMMSAVREQLASRTEEVVKEALSQGTPVAECSKSISPHSSAGKEELRLSPRPCASTTS